MIQGQNAVAQISDRQPWVGESAELAKHFVYAQPVSLGRNMLLSRDYETTARNIARSHAALAAATLPHVYARSPCMPVSDLMKADAVVQVLERRSWSIDIPQTVSAT
jgi:hypothetical protein